MIFGPKSIFATRKTKKREAPHRSPNHFAVVEVRVDGGAPPGGAIHAQPRVAAERPAPGPGERTESGRGPSAAANKIANH